MTISEVLRKAADIIDHDGWYSGKGPIPPIDDGSPACLIMAVYRAAGREYTVSYYGAINRVEKYLNLARLDFNIGLASWNDSQTSKDDVTALLRTVATLQNGVTEMPQ